MKIDQLSIKTLEIEELVQRDLGNGRHAQKRLRYKILRAGKCTEEVCEELMSIKLED